MTTRRVKPAILLALLVAGGMATWILFGGPGVGTPVPVVRSPTPDVPVPDNGAAQHALLADRAQTEAASASASDVFVEASPTVRERFAQGLVLWRERRVAREAARAQGVDEDRDAADEALAEVRSVLAAQLRTVPGLDGEVWSAVEAAEREEALALARLLRSARSAALGARLADRVRNAATPVLREAALVAIEGRAADVWLEAATEAFQSDTDAGVRTRASQLMGRALGDRQYMADREPIRAPLLNALSSADPGQRQSAVLALGWDAFAERDDLERILEVSRSDTDAEVRRAATAAARVLASRLDARGAR